MLIVGLKRDAPQPPRLAAAVLEGTLARHRRGRSRKRPKDVCSQCRRGARGGLRHAKPQDQRLPRTRERHVKQTGLLGSLLLCAILGEREEPLRAATGVLVCRKLLGDLKPLGLYDDASASGVDAAGDYRSRGARGLPSTRQWQRWGTRAPFGACTVSVSAHLV